MPTPRFHLMEAENAGIRMDALCRFIEFWLGPRKPEYGEPHDKIAGKNLPMPLRCLYEFAGRWPSWDGNMGSGEYCVPAFSKQDSLVALNRLETKEDGKIVFLWENQGNWDCRTIVTPDDPPVWCRGDHQDNNGNWYTGEKLVCDSLSRFLVTFVLQEITLGSRFHLADEGLDDLYQAQKQNAVPLWLNGPYVHGEAHEFFLWGHVLVASMWDSYIFAANDENGICNLTEQQGPIHEIRLTVGVSWSLDIRSDGSATLRFSQGSIDERAEAPARTFDFAFQRDFLAKSVSSQGHYERNPMVIFMRKGQSVFRGQHLQSWNVARALYERALQSATHASHELRARFLDLWKG